MTILKEVFECICTFKEKFDEEKETYNKYYENNLQTKKILYAGLIENKYISNNPIEWTTTSFDITRGVLFEVTSELIASGSGTAGILEEIEGINGL